MIVCVCKNIKTNDIKQAMCQGACKMRDLYEKLGLASQCGKCAPQALEILRTQPTNNQPFVAQLAN